MIVSDPFRNDLAWLLLGDFRGDLGVRSSMSACIETLQRGGHVDGGHPSTEMDEAMIDAATRLKRLTRRWQALAPEHQRTLATHYAATRRVLGPEFGDLGALVLARPLAAQEHRASKSDKHLVVWLSRLVGRTAGTPILARIRQDAQAALDAARQAWSATRGGLRR